MDTMGPEKLNGLRSRFTHFKFIFHFALRSFLFTPTFWLSILFFRVFSVLEICPHILLGSVRIQAKLLQFVRIPRHFLLLLTKKFVHTLLKLKNTETFWFQVILSVTNCFQNQLPIHKFDNQSNLSMCTLYICTYKLT